MQTPFFKDQTIPFLLTLIGSMILFFGVLFTASRLYDQRRHWVVIDTQPLVRASAEDLASLYKNGKVPPAKLQAIVDELRAKAQAFAKKNHLILLDKNVVWGGDLPNETRRFLLYLAHDARNDDTQKETSDAPE
ncbi:MAG: hypothetical protein KBD23_01665 [Gammaproteobacteria bacterium]|nr:hypothetical protein [Gammaproteobacteria bacterium]MBP9728833.1 hypothetical protein [Gammaproteobacteria bacterium]